MVQRLHGDNANHPDVACSLKTLGSIALVNESLDEAEQLTRQSFEIYSRIYGKDVYNRHLASCLNQLGQVAERKEYLDDAEHWYRKGFFGCGNSCTIRTPTTNWSDLCINWA